MGKQIERLAPNPGQLIEFDARVRWYRPLAMGNDMGVIREYTGDLLCRVYRSKGSAWVNQGVFGGEGDSLASCMILRVNNSPHM